MFTSVNKKNESRRFDGQSFRVLVLPVHSRETRHVSFLSRLDSFLSRRVARETRCVSRDGGNLPLSGTVHLTWFCLCATTAVLGVPVAAVVVETWF